MSETRVADDKDILLRLSKGDEHAFRLLYDEFHKRVYQQAFMYLRSEELAGDVVQDVFLKIWSYREQLPRVRELRNYLFILARNVIITHLRKRVLHQYLDEELQLIDDTVPLPDKQLSIKQSMQIVRDAIDTLPPQQRLAYTLSRDKGLSYEEIAEEMKISQYTVKSHVSQALKTLRRYLTDRSIDFALLLVYLLFEK